MYVSATQLARLFGFRIPKLIKCFFDIYVNDKLHAERSEGEGLFIIISKHDYDYDLIIILGVP